MIRLSGTLRKEQFDPTSDKGKITYRGENKLCICRNVEAELNSLEEAVGIIKLDEFEKPIIEYKTNL